MVSGQRTEELVEMGEWSLRLDWHEIVLRQRAGFPVQLAIRIGGAPANIISDWQNEFSDWFIRRKDFWRKVWFKVVLSTQIKLTTQEAFDEYIEDRARTAGLELTAINARVIDEVFLQHSRGSVKNLSRALRESIGLNPRQFSAFVKQAAAIDKLYKKNPERARLIKDRLYQKKINYRAQVIARTEMSNAINKAQIADVKARQINGDLPLQMEKRWSTVGDNTVSEGCQQNEAEGWIDIDGVFSSGHEQPPRFPGCRCGVQFRKART